MLDNMDFPYPMFLTTWHMFLSMILTQIMSKTTKMLPGVAEVILLFLVYDYVVFLIIIIYY